MNAIEARNIAVERGGARLVDAVNLRIAPGEFHILIGPNGSGKSTILRALAGLWPVAAGEVLVDGQPLASIARRDVARTISYVPQDTRIDFAFTVEEIVSMGRFAHRGRFERESAADRQAVEVALDRCDVAPLRHRAVNTLSGGERQRAVIARSLAAQARYLLLDEPTANLDVRHSVEVFELCRKLAAEGQAIVLATHDLAAAARYAGSLSVVNAGRLAITGSASQVLTMSLIAQVFGVSAERLLCEDGQPVYAFHPLNITAPASPAPAKTLPSGSSAPAP